MSKVNFHTQINAKNYFGTIIAIWTKWSHKKTYGKIVNRETTSRKICQRKRLSKTLILHKIVNIECNNLKKKQSTALAKANATSCRTFWRHDVLLTSQHNCWRHVRTFNVQNTYSSKNKDYRQHICNIMAYLWTSWRNINITTYCLHCLKLWHTIWCGDVTNLGKAISPQLNVQLF